MIEAILDACLEDILMRHATIADCLVKYPEYADELEVMLEVAVAIQSVPDVKPSEEFKWATRARLEGGIDQAASSDGRPKQGLETKENH
jgi:hypothetical protein